MARVIGPGPLLVALSCLAAAADAPATFREETDSYSFERPLDWRLDGFPGGFFIRSPRFGGAMILGHQAPAPAGGLEALQTDLMRSVLGMANLRDGRILQTKRVHIGGQEAVQLRYAGRAVTGADLHGVASAVVLPNRRVLSILVRSIPGERLAEYGPVYDQLLASVRLESPSADEPARERRAVREAFYAYKHAAILAAGRSAARLASRGTLDYYGRMRALALEAKEAETRKLPLAEKLMVLSLRHRIGGPTLAGMTAEAVFAHAVSKRWIDEDTVATGEVGSVDVEGRVARAAYFQAGQSMPYRFGFSKEEDGWKLDFVPLLTGSAEQLAPVIRASGQTEDAFVIALLEKGTGKAVPASIWGPAGTAR
jgi:hypothetical protein